MRSILACSLSLALVSIAHAAANPPIVPSIHDVIPDVLPTVSVTSGAIPFSLSPPPERIPPATDPSTVLTTPLFPLDMIPPVSHAKSPKERAADTVFDEEKNTFDVKQRARIAEYIGRATQRPTGARSAGSATVYGYREGQIYLVYAGLDRLTDIELEPGESLTADPVAGDTEGWIKGQFTSGSGPAALTHIVVKPRDDGIETNLIIPTSRRVYQLDLRAKADWYMPAVRWFYPDEEAAAIVKKEGDDQAKQSSSEALAVSPDRLNFRYRISGRDMPWKPTQVFDDGTKVYLEMPDRMTTSDAPALFVMENGQPLLVNYRVKDRLYIVDRLFETAQLRVGAKQTINVERCSAHAWFCH